MAVDFLGSYEEKQKAKAAKHAERRQKKLKVNEAVQKEGAASSSAEGYCKVYKVNKMEPTNPNANTFKKLHMSK